MRLGRSVLTLEQLDEQRPEPPEAVLAQDFPPLTGDGAMKGTGAVNQCDLPLTSSHPLCYRSPAWGGPTPPSQDGRPGSRGADQPRSPRDPADRTIGRPGPDGGFTVVRPTAASVSVRLSRGVPITVPR